MSRRVPLHAIAHARAGDKGDTSNVSVWLDDPAQLDAVAAQLTPERLRVAFPALLRGAITVHRLPALGGLNIVMHEALEGGVNRSLGLDGHGKSWSCLLLGLEVELPE
jgi:hypothetical protein